MTTKTVGCWEKLYVIHGEPTQCRLAKTAVIHKSNVETTVYLSGDDELTAVKNVLHGMCFSKTALVINRPTNDQCKIILSAFENNRCNPDVVIIAAPGEYLDSRWTFVTTATKKKRIYSYDFVESNDRTGLFRYLKSWCELNEVLLSPEAHDHIYYHGPTISAKIKGGNGQKKDAIIYNLESLSNELDKVLVVNNTKNFSYDEIVAYCNFDRVDDVWNFIRVAVGGKPKEILRKLESSTAGTSLESALWMLLSQIDFLLQVSQCGSTNPYDVTKKLSLDGILGAYLTDDFNDPPQIELPIVNSWRVKNALEERAVWKNVDLAKSYKAIVSALQDLRGKLDEKIVAVSLSLALAGMITYDSPLVGNFDQ